MADSESCQDRQKNELAVLKSIFGDELHEKRKSKNKKKWQPLEISITLTPQQGMSGPTEVHAKIDLHISCCDEYPEVAPTLQLNNSLGLSNEKISVLLNELKNLSERLKGEVMIFDLAQHVQKFLHENNKPSFESFYEEMVSRQQEKIQSEKQMLKEKELEEEKERQLLQDEIHKRREALNAELTKRRGSDKLTHDMNQLSITHMQSSQSSTSLLSLERGNQKSSRRRHRSSSAYLDNKNCIHQGTELIEFDNNWGQRQVHRGRCLGHSSKGSNVYAGVDKISGELLAITEWSFKNQPSGNNKESKNNHINNVDNSAKQISAIENEINTLQRLQHNNLVRYYNLKTVQEEDGIIIYIVQEFVVGTTCSFLLAKHFPVNPEILRHIATGVLSALEFLHNNNIVHKDLRDTSIHIDRQGTVKVSDYALNKRLSDIYNSNCMTKDDNDFPTIQGRGGKKLDIYRFGIIMLSLLKGTIITEKDIDWGANIKHSGLRDFLAKCLNDDERSRWSAQQLQTHAFISTPLERGISPPIFNRRNSKKNSESEELAYDLQKYLPALDCHSRIQTEFEALEFLGKGAYGDVIKAKNKLDGGIYAIKRIRLDVKSKQLNKKITREVKLLSRLNHENVVRYYNSWIEHATITDTDGVSISQTSSSSSSSSSSSPSQQSDVDESIQNNNHIINNNINKPKVSTESDGDDENDSSDEDWDLLRLTANESSDFIEFQKEDSSRAISNNSKSADNDKSKTSQLDINNDIKKETQFLYIQMEFCEKSTLRTAIDRSLYQDEERVWRLFREIIEGLDHIHQQGMIHRDLKPVNIFLDSNDHVKIGDFGLATTNILPPFSNSPPSDYDTNMQDKIIMSDTEDQLHSMTGQVGTALYVAPELNSKTSKAMYNQKVDIYSLGIILFEMFYRPMDTGMERIKTLMDIRSKEIILPDDINENSSKKKVKILRSLLSHDPSQRPTSHELLTSEFLPPPLLEEAELQDMIGHTLSNKQSKSYKYLVGSCFEQNVTPAEDITYDMIIPQKNMINKNIISCCCDINSSLGFVREYVKSKIVEVFQCHGGIDITTPLLMPKSGHIYNDTEACVKLMTKSGSIVTLPHDLRAPFARYIAWNNITHHRRYTIERVYREKLVNGFHPHELLECAFDIVSPTMSLMVESELIYIVWKILENLPELYERTFTIRLNHTSLLKAVLMYCDIEPDKYQDIYMILCDARSGRISKFQVQTHLISLCLSDQAMALLFNLFDIESPPSKIMSVLKSITKRKCDSAILVKEGLNEIDTVMSNAVALGVKFPIIVAPLLVPNTQYNGIFYQITCEPLKPKRRGGNDVVAAGGRYDEMLKSFRQILEKAGLAKTGVTQHAVGISISFDKLVSTVIESNKDGHDYTIKSSDMKYGLNVAVCCTDGLPKRESELASLLSDLWKFGFRVTVLDSSTTQEAINHCSENSITHIILLQTGENDIYKLCTWERDRYNERKFSSNDIIDHFQKHMDSLSNKSETKVSTINYDINHPRINVNVHFLLDGKVLVGSRRACENVILSQTAPFLQKMLPKLSVDIFAVSLDMAVIKIIVSHLEVDESQQDCEKSIQLITDKYPRDVPYIEDICCNMIRLRKQKSRPTLIMYSLEEHRSAVLLSHSF